MSSNSAAMPSSSMAPPPPPTAADSTAAQKRGPGASTTSADGIAGGAVPAPSVDTSAAAAAAALVAMPASSATNTTAAVAGDTTASSSSRPQATANSSRTDASGKATASTGAPVVPVHTSPSIKAAASSSAAPSVAAGSAASSRKPGPVNRSSSASSAASSSSTPGPSGASTAKRRKVSTACIYCRRSHMTCDEGRPCQRCIKRDIGHLCHDEATHNQLKASSASATATPEAGAHKAGNGVAKAAQASNPRPKLEHDESQANTMAGPMSAAGGTLSSSSLDLQGAAGQTEGGTAAAAAAAAAVAAAAAQFQQQQALEVARQHQVQMQLRQSAVSPSSTPSVQNGAGALPSRSLPAGFGSKAERFLITAADQTDGTRDERLRKVIHAKYDAGLLKPYNHVNGYARLNRWMEKNVSPQSRRRILKPLSVFRPAFRAIAQSLTNVDLLIIEEHFERLLLDYDRVFSTQGIPACLWRRTGEIYKGNKEFANLIGVNIDSLRDGRLCIYELMAEESAVNYWEKYGAVSFDPGQKAVLTSCILRARTHATNSSAAATGGLGGMAGGTSSTGSVKDGNDAQTPAKSHRSLSISSTNGGTSASGGGGGGGASTSSAPASGRLASSNRIAPMTPVNSSMGTKAQSSSSVSAASGEASAIQGGTTNGTTKSAGANDGSTNPAMSGILGGGTPMVPTASSSSSSSNTRAANGSEGGVGLSGSGGNGGSGGAQPAAASSSTATNATTVAPKTPLQIAQAQLSASSSLPPGGSISGGGGGEEVLIPCCFSFTIRRDQWNIPICIVGNFLMIDPP